MADQDNSEGEDASPETTPKKKTVKRARTRTAKSAAKPAESAEVQTTFDSEPAAEKPSAPAKAKEELKDAPEPRDAPTEPQADADDDIPAYESDADMTQPPAGGREGGPGGNRNGPPRGKKGRGKKNKWKKRDPKDRPPAQPLPPGMEEVKIGELPDAALFEDLAALDEEAATSHKSSEDPIRLHEMYPLGIAELGAQGTALGAEIEGVPSRRAWLEAIFRTAAEKELPLTDHGWLDMTDDGYGFVVHSHVAYRLYPENSYVPASLVKRYGLKRGHEVKVTVRPPKEGERCPAVIGIDSVMDKEPESIGAIKPFEELEPYYPLQRILMEAPVHKDISMRAVDLLTPIGFGQRGLIVAPPRTGKTVLMQNMANSVSNNFPEAKLILLLIDE